VELGHCARFVERDRRRVRNDTDRGTPDLIVAARRHSLANRIFAGEVGVGERAIDDDDELARVEVALVDGAAPNQSQSHGVEEPRGDPMKQDARTCCTLDRPEQRPTSNYQFPTTSNFQLPRTTNWELGIGSGWKLGVGRWELSRSVRLLSVAIDEKADRPHDNQHADDDETDGSGETHARSSLVD
jgi:hypothetical protein